MSSRPYKTINLVHVLVNMKQLSNTGKVRCLTFLSISFHNVHKAYDTAIMDFWHNLYSEEDIGTVS